MKIVKIKNSKYSLILLLTFLLSLSCSSQKKQTEDLEVTFPIEEIYEHARVVCTSPKQYKLSFDSLCSVELGYYSTMNPYIITLENSQIKFDKEYVIKIESYIIRDDLYINLCDNLGIYTLCINQATSYPVTDMLYFKKNTLGELYIDKIERHQGESIHLYNNDRIMGAYIDLVTNTIEDPPNDKSIDL